MWQVLFSSGAHACGVSAADGIAACSLSEHEEAERPRWRVAATGLFTSTALSFTGDLRSPETRAAVLGSVAYQPSRRLALQASLGATVAGELATPTGTYQFSPGPSAAIGASWRAVERGRGLVILTSQISFSAVTTHLRDDAGGSTGYQALDLRAGVLAGGTVFRVLSAYAIGRVFGGPVFWRYQGAAVIGTDVHHFQVGVGLTLRIASRVNVFAEGIPLGEQAFSSGAAVGF